MSIIFAIVAAALFLLWIGYIIGWQMGWKEHSDLFWPMLEAEQEASKRTMSWLKDNLEAIGVPVNGEPERRN